MFNKKVVEQRPMKYKVSLTDDAIGDIEDIYTTRWDKYCERNLPELTKIQND